MMRGRPLDDDSEDQPEVRQFERAAAAIDHRGPVNRVRLPILTAAEAVTLRDRSAIPARRPWRTRQPEPFRGRWTGACLRPLVRPVLAGVVALVVAGGTVAASTAPGAPLYATRIALEAALLPVSGAATRPEAELALADRRLGEAEGAIERGDRSAAIAALDAFTERIRSLVMDPVDSEAAGRLREALARDAATLELLRSRARDEDVRAEVSTGSREVASARDALEAWLRAARRAPRSVQRTTSIAR